MTPDVPLGLLSLLAQDLGGPRVVIGSFVVEGEAAWRAADWRAIPRERLWLLAAARRHLLVATPGGRARLRAWLDAPRPSGVPPLRQRIDEGLLFYGDEDVLPVAIEAFVRLPAPVRDTLLKEIAVLAVGSRTNAWTAPSRLVDRDGRSRSRVIVISGRDRTWAELLLTLGHELGHAWHVALPREYDMNITAQGRAGLKAFAAAEGLAEKWAAAEAQSERLADACAYAWLGAGAAEGAH